MNNKVIHRCSVCGHDIFDFERCRHIPGEVYKVIGDDGSVVGEELCAMLIERVQFEEVSDESKH